MMTENAKFTGPKDNVLVRASVLVTFAASVPMREVLNFSSTISAVCSMAAALTVPFIFLNMGAIACSCDTDSLVG